MHLAELNLSVWKYDPDTNKASRGFLDNVDRINALAERSDGFVWRIRDEERDENGRNAICDGPETLMTMSVWDTAEHLEHFVFKTLHKRFWERKEEWFGRMDSHHVVMWWVEEGHRPTMIEAKERLDHLNAKGESDFAFTWETLGKSLKAAGPEVLKTA